MNTLLIIFETEDQAAHQNIVGYIQREGSWARLTPTSWLVKTHRGLVDFRNDLRTQSVGTKIAVFNVTGDGWGTTFSDEVTNWMKENV